MGQERKPGVPWLEIEQRIRAGESARSVSRSMKAAGTPISHVEIARHSRQKGWVPGKADSWKEAVNRLPSVARTILPPVNSKRTPEIVAQILGNIELGMTEANAAAAAGIAPGTLSHWKSDDAQMAVLMETARRRSLGMAEHEVAQAGARGDWRASVTRLERAKETRDDWAPRASGSSGPSVSINFGWNRQPDTANVTIEGDATPTDS